MFQDWEHSNLVAMFVAHHLPKLKLVPSIFETPSTRRLKPKGNLRATIAGTCERQAGCCQTKHLAILGLFVSVNIFEAKFLVEIMLFLFPDVPRVFSDSLENHQRPKGT